MFNLFLTVSSRSRSISPMKQVDKPRKPGTPIINGKITSIENNDYIKYHNLSKTTTNANKYNLHPNLLKSTNYPHTKGKITPIVNSTRSYKYGIRSTSQDSNKTISKIPLPRNLSSTSTSGISTADTMSAISTTPRKGMSLNLITKMPPITGIVNHNEKDSTLNEILHKGSKRSAQTIKINQTQNLMYTRKNTYTITKDHRGMRQQEKKFLDANKNSDDDGDVNEQSEDDAKSNVTYRIR